MFPLWQTVRDVPDAVDAIRRRRYGVIEIVDGQLSAIRLRPFPKIVSVVEAWIRGERFHQEQSGNRCWLYYNQPLRFRSFLALTYTLSTGDCTLQSARLALRVLDEIARIKQTDAILCDVANFRISDRLLARWGWCPHKQQRWHRNHIKRFYGEYPQPLFSEIS